MYPLKKSFKTFRTRNIYSRKLSRTQYIKGYKKVTFLSLNWVMMVIMNVRGLDVISQPPQMDMIIYTAVISVTYRHSGV